MLEVISQSSYVIQTIIKLPRQNLVYRAETGSHRAEVGCYRPENLSTALKVVSTAPQSLFLHRFV